MQFGGRYIFAAPRQLVWEALNNADALEQAIPGCKRIQWTGENSLEAEISVNLGIARPTFKGDLILSNIDPAVSYTLSGRGRGGLLGLAHGEAKIALSDQNGGTLLTFSAEGGGSGQLMKLGKAVIGGRAQAIIDGFFERIGAATNIEVTPT